MVQKPISRKKTTSKSSGRSSNPPSSDQAPSRPLSPASAQELKHQQRLLDLFSNAFHGALSSRDFPALLQEIKHALFTRDFAAAFAREACLEAYAARWGPTRALCYASVLRAIRAHVDAIAALLPPGPPTNLKMLSIGGSAPELVAFAACLHDKAGSFGALTLIDSAPWAAATALLQKQITTPPSLFKYASAAVKASNRALLHHQQLSLTFLQRDILSLNRDELVELVRNEPLLVTLLFTLNELYTSGGIGETTKFLKELGEVLTNGSLLLVVDSPGSFSEAAVGKEHKRYPMQWLLNHTLLETTAQFQDYRWERLESYDSIWFRLPDELSYPIPLENMRYQMHLYRRGHASISDST